MFSSSTILYNVNIIETIGRYNQNEKKKIIDVAGEILFHYIDLGEIVILYDTDNLEMIQICFNFFHNLIRSVQSEIPRYDRYQKRNETMK